LPVPREPVIAGYQKVRIHSAEPGFNWRVFVDQADKSVAVEPMLRHHQRSSPGPSGRRVVGHVSGDIQPARILIIEDELLIALMIEEMTREIGYRVSGVAHTMAMASREFGKRNYDAVLLDINIGGQYHAVTADHLLGSGVPFAFVTGYDYLVEPRHEKVPVLQKPFTATQLRALLEELLHPLTSAEQIAQAG
jgi:CheY-like chemotaxis protein